MRIGLLEEAVCYWYRNFKLHGAGMSCDWHMWSGVLVRKLSSCFYFELSWRSTDFQHCSIIFIILWEAKIMIEVKIRLNVQS